MSMAGVEYNYSVSLYSCIVVFNMAVNSPGCQGLGGWHGDGHHQIHADDWCWSV